mgnify:CR=1 FL=1
MKIGSEKYYRQALQICTLDLSNQDGSNNIETSECLFKMGTLLGEMGEIPGAIRCFNDAFILRDSSLIPAKTLFKEFHDIQMAIYILGKSVKTIKNYAEGDMVHDLIKHRWIDLQLEIRESQFPFVCEDMKAWFKTVHIDFPYGMEEILEMIESIDDPFSHRG